MKNMKREIKKSYMKKIRQCFPIYEKKNGSI